jgi:hypothetical protein
MPAPAGVYNVRHAAYHTYLRGTPESKFAVGIHYTDMASAAVPGNPGSLSGPVVFGKNFDKKVRKHIDQVRNRGPIREDIFRPDGEFWTILVN